MILLLLVGFKAISQNVIQSKDSVVVLSEKQARDVASDLVRYDYLKHVSKEQEKRISNLKIAIDKLENIITIKDSVIFYQKDYINTQNEILRIKPKPQIHSYIGVQSAGFTFNRPLLSGRVLLEYKKINFGVQYIGMPTTNNQYGLLVEYKLF